MKMTKEEIKKKNFYVVPDGFMVMPPAHYNAWQKVTDVIAVAVDDNIYCTQRWKDELFKMAGL